MLECLPLRAGPRIGSYRREPESLRSLAGDRNPDRHPSALVKRIMGQLVARVTWLKQRHRVMTTIIVGRPTTELLVGKLNRVCQSIAQHVTGVVMTDLNSPNEGENSGNHSG
jgi:hypothetical protein